MRWSVLRARVSSTGMDTVDSQRARRRTGGTLAGLALLPLLAIALRSVRPAERRAALAALCRAAFVHQDLRRSIEDKLPELELFASEEGR